MLLVSSGFDRTVDDDDAETDSEEQETDRYIVLLASKSRNRQIQASKQTTRNSGYCTRDFAILYLGTIRAAVSNNFLCIVLGHCDIVLGTLRAVVSHIFS